MNGVMPRVTLDHVTPETPMGATLVADGATFRLWAPRASAVHVIGEFNGRVIDAASLLVRNGQGHWHGFVRGVQNHDRYRYQVIGAAGAGPKRDPHARELVLPFPSDCIVRRPDFPWHDTGFRTPRFEDMVIYQLHVGSFDVPRWPTGGCFLDVALRLPHLARLGVTALQLLPIQEFQTNFGLGYNGVDYYSPEMGYAVAEADLGPYLARLNALLAALGQAPYAADDLHGEMNQLKALVDLCHLHGLAVVLDVVYNHAGGSFDDESLYFLDRELQGPVSGPSPPKLFPSLYFTTQGHAGGLVFDYRQDEVREFLIGNARFLLDEYRVDGLRYDQVSVIDHDGQPKGWRFCQDLTSTIRFHCPCVWQLAEYWGVNPFVVRPVDQGGAGFDSSLTNGLRIAIREVIAEASRPDERPLPMAQLGEAMWPQGFAEHWRFVQGPENHDLVYFDPFVPPAGRAREMRVARLGQPDDPHSWYGRSRARVASGLGLTAPGIPMLFMGQEMLQAEPWSDDIGRRELLLPWAELDAGDRDRVDHLRFMRELITLRWTCPGLRGAGFRVVLADNLQRVLAFHRWVPGVGDDVLVVVHLAPFHCQGYAVGFPGGGRWREVFNSDVYERWVNPRVAGNGGTVEASGAPLHGFEASAALVLPQNSLLVFTR